VPPTHEPAEDCGLLRLPTAGSGLILVESNFVAVWMRRVIKDTGSLYCIAATTEHPLECMALRKLAADKGLVYGTTLSAKQITGDPEFVALVLREAGLVVAENTILAPTAAVLPSVPGTVRTPASIAAR
jgi:hypothetical protein